MSDLMIALPTSIQIASLNRSTQDVYYLLRQKALKATDLQRKTRYSPRTIRSALKILLDFRLITRLPDLRDLRSCFYQAAAA